MAETEKRCEYEMPIGSKDDSIKCRRPALRVGTGGYYCREHFAILIDAAKSLVVLEAIELVKVTWGSRSRRNCQCPRLTGAVIDLETLVGPWKEDNENH